MGGFVGGHGRLRTASRLLGPGLVSGASDVDPTTVGAVAVIGATTVYQLSWLVLLIFPLMAVIQVIATRLGLVTGSGLQTGVVRRYPRWAQWLLAVSVIAVNVFTVAADLQAGGAALGLLLGHDSRWLMIVLSVAVLALLLLGAMQQVQRVLKWFVLCLLAYAIAMVLARPNWGAVMRATVLPHPSLTAAVISGALALVGTTLTSYVYIWQSVQQAEHGPEGDRLRWARADAVIGILVSVAVIWAILIATGATLGTHHLGVDTAQQAAEALRPVAGGYATVVFGIGLLASSLVALPVLLGTTGYVLGAQLGWRHGLSHPLRRAPAFYASLIVTMLCAVGIGLSGVPAIRLLFLASIAGGLATPIGLVLLLLLAANRTVMGSRAITGWLRVAGWAVTALITVMGLAYLAQQLLT